MTAYATIDAFSGPRGWDVGARAAGLPDALGIEHDADACSTSRAAGFPTLQADVAAVPLATYAHATGHIASPPCPTFSSAGSGSGRDDMPLLVRYAHAIATGAPKIAPPKFVDDRTRLCAEPLRWAIALLPTWIAWEQVPPVLPFWEVCAEILTASGYDVWTGLLRAEQYGVPQTRTRAFLLARRDGEPVRPPAPTHRRYLPPKKHDGGGLFDVAELTERRVHPEDRALLPWVSMAEALGWAEGGTVRTGTNSMVSRDRDADLVPYERSLGDPSPTVVGNVGRWKLRCGNHKNATERAIDEPAPTLLFGHRSNSVEFVPPTGYDRRQVDGRTGIPVRVRSVGEPAPTMTGEGNGAWVFDRPATTVTTDPRIARPGHHGTGQDGDAERSMTDAVRVTVEQAAALQSFPPDHPWQGSRSSQYRQVGNAVPPLLARRVIEAVAGPEIHAARERRAA